MAQNKYISSKAWRAVEDYLVDTLSICHQPKEKSQPGDRPDWRPARINWQCDCRSNFIFTIHHLQTFDRISCETVVLKCDAKNSLNFRFLRLYHPTLVTALSSPACFPPSSSCSPHLFVSLIAPSFPTICPSLPTLLSPPHLPSVADLLQTEWKACRIRHEFK